MYIAIVALNICLAPNRGPIWQEEGICRTYLRGNELIISIKVSHVYMDALILKAEAWDNVNIRCCDDSQSLFDAASDPVYTALFNIRVVRKLLLMLRQKHMRYSKTRGISTRFRCIDCITWGPYKWVNSSPQFDQMTAISWTIFLYAFSWIQKLYLDLKFTEACY